MVAARSIPRSASSGCPCCRCTSTTAGGWPARGSAGPTTPATFRASAGPGSCWRASARWRSPAGMTWPPAWGRRRTTCWAPARTGSRTATAAAASPRTPCPSCARSAGRWRSPPTTRSRSSTATRRSTPPSIPESGESTRDWFSLELGIEVEGRRINLLPALLQLLEQVPASARLDTALPARGRFFALPVGEHRYVTIPPDRLLILLKVLRELYQPGENDGARLRFPAIAAGALAELDAAFGRRPDGSAGPALDAAPPRAPSRIAPRPCAWGRPPRSRPPPGLRAELRPYQRQGLAWLQHLRALDAGGVLADDMGLGKTLQAIAHIVAEKDAGPAGSRRRWWWRPTSLVGNWQRELARFAPVPERAGAARPGPPPAVAEAGARRCGGHHLPGAAARRGAAGEASSSTWRCWTRRRRSRTRAARPTSWSLKHRGPPADLPVGHAGGEQPVASCGRCSSSATPACWATPSGSPTASPARSSARTAPSAWPTCAPRWRPFILRRIKEQVARELPPKTEIIRPVELYGSQRDLYESLRLAVHAEVRQAIAAKGLGASTITILDALMKLRQVCCDPRLLPGEAAREVRESAKYQLLMELVTQQRAAGRRMLIFSQFATMLGLIGQGLRQAGISFVALTGVDGQPPEAGRRVPGGQGRRVPDQPEGGRHRAEPDHRRHRDPLRPLVEPRRAGPGHRSRPPHRPDKARCSSTT